MQPKLRARIRAESGSLNVSGSVERLTFGTKPFSVDSSDFPAIGVDTRPPSAVLLIPITPRPVPRSSQPFFGGFGSHGA